jgi:hypothetical protein
MYAIEATDERLPWLSGVFEKRADAERYFAMIPEDLRRCQWIVEIQFSTYPFFIVEKCRPEKDGFHYLDANGVRAILKALTPVGNKDGERLIIYVVTEDFFASDAGTDNMGLLNHWHITNRELSRRQRGKVMSSLLKAPQRQQRALGGRQPGAGALRLTRSVLLKNKGSRLPEPFPSLIGA